MVVGVAVGLLCLAGVSVVRAGSLSGLAEEVVKDRALPSGVLSDAACRLDILLSDPAFGYKEKTW